MICLDKSFCTGPKDNCEQNKKQQQQKIPAENYLHDLSQLACAKKNQLKRSVK